MFVDLLLDLDLSGVVYGGGQAPVEEGRVELLRGVQVELLEDTQEFVEVIGLKVREDQAKEAARQRV